MALNSLKKYDVLGRPENVGPVLDVIKRYPHFELDPEFPELYFAIGGDGTTLYPPNKEKIIGKDVPVLQIHHQEDTVKSQGFWPDVNKSGVAMALEDIIAGNYSIRKDEMLKCSLDGKMLGHVINEADFEHNERMKTIELGMIVELDGKLPPYNTLLMPSPRLDRVLIGTNRGSTAWAYSYDGPISWDNPGIYVNFIGAPIPYRHFGFEINDKIFIETKQDCMVALDVNQEFSVESGRRLKVERSNKQFKTIQTGRTVETLTAKLERSGEYHQRGLKVRPFIIGEDA